MLGLGAQSALGNITSANYNRTQLLTWQPDMLGSSGTAFDHTAPYGEARVVHSLSIC